MWEMENKRTRRKEKVQPKYEKRGEHCSPGLSEPFSAW